MDIQQKLKEHEIKPSLHRMRILEYLIERKNHPTVDMIFQDISREIPTLSKTTIYNTLKTFSDRGVVQTVTIEENEVRYDADTSLHGHFKCKKCNAIIDIHTSEMNINVEIDGHAIEETHLYLFGICKNCRTDI